MLNRLWIVEGQWHHTASWFDHNKWCSYFSLLRVGDGVRVCVLSACYEKETKTQPTTTNQFSLKTGILNMFVAIEIFAHVWECIWFWKAGKWTVNGEMLECTYIYYTSLRFDVMWVRIHEIFFFVSNISAQLQFAWIQ